MDDAGEALITKYRPDTLKKVVGQKEVVKSLDRAIERGLSHTILFTGPSGTGKTTLARIALSMIGCTKPGDILQYDAASLSGIDDIRQLKIMLGYRPIGEGRKKGVIIDEAHGLSRQAMDALLLETEQAREYVYWIFCTTEAHRIRETIRTRFLSYALQPVHVEDIIDLLEQIADAEDFHCNMEVIKLCAREARGSPRQAISNLAICADVADRESAAKLLRSADFSTEAVDLARALVKRASWGEIRDIVGRCAESNPESIRYVVVDYVGKVLSGERDEGKAEYLWCVLNAFIQPFPPMDNMSPVLNAVGNVFWRNTRHGSREDERRR